MIAAAGAVRRRGAPSRRRSDLRPPCAWRFRRSKHALTNIPLIDVKPAQGMLQFFEITASAGFAADRYDTYADLPALGAAVHAASAANAKAVHFVTLSSYLPALIALAAIPCMPLRNGFAAAVAIFSARARMPDAPLAATDTMTTRPLMKTKKTLCLHE